MRMRTHWLPRRVLAQRTDSPQSTLRSDWISGRCVQEVAIPRGFAGRRKSNSEGESALATKVSTV